MLLTFLTIFSYFAAFIAILAFGSRKNRPGEYIALGASVVSLVSVLAMLASRALWGEHIFASYRIQGLNFDFGFLVDQLSLLLGFIVSFVATLVFLYSRDYMRDDPEKGRFFALLSFFAGSMLGIVYSVSFAQLFIFWEFVGLSSYFLIGFWYRDPVVSSSARKVFTVIVVGDVLLLAGFLLLGQAFGTFTFLEMNREYIHVALPAAGVFLVLLGAFTKSAQMPFSLWLPWAMEGPTPVSALLHAATMVKAGIFLIARIYPLVVAAHLLPFVLVFALITIFVSSLFALVERDIKRILAYSTVSQLGFMALGLGLGVYGAALFHLFNDAFYKALLFLGAGVIIHAGATRDIFNLKPLSWAKEKVFLALTIVGVFGISGLPPFNGFFSKDLIIDAAKETQNPVLYSLVLAAAFLSALYIARWITLILSKVSGFPLLSGSRLSRAASRDESGNGAMPPREAGQGESHGEKETFGKNTKIAMGVLAVGVLISGWLGKGFFRWLGLHEAPHYNLAVSFSSIVLISVAFFLAHSVYISKAVSFARVTRLFALIGKALDAKLGVLWFYNLLARFSRALGEAFGVVDRYIIDTVLNGAALAARGVSSVVFAVDRYVIDGALNSLARGTIAFCFSAHRFDLGIIDRVVGWFNVILVFLSAHLRRLVTGLATSYAVALLIGVIALSFLFHFALAR